MTTCARPSRRRGGAALPAVLVLAIAAGCGKKGPPLAPLRLVPAAVSELSGRVAGKDVQLRFVLPTANANGPGHIDLDHVEIYAATVPAGGGLPNRDLFTHAHLVGTVSVKPVLQGEQPVDAKPDDRPGPGDRVTFVDTLTPEKTTPDPAYAGQPAAAPTTAGAAPATGAGTTPPSGTTAPAGTTPPGAATPPAPATPPAGTMPPAAAAAPPASAPPPSPYPLRIYGVRGVSRGGRAGPPSPRVEIPVVQPPPVPADVAIAVTERALKLTWMAPVAEPGAPALTFNVYGSAEGAPLNSAPLSTATYEHTPVEFGAEQCFAVRAVEIVRAIAFESEPSSRACVTPRDTFPPAAPRNATAISPGGSMQLSWDANTEGDLAGYLILRAEAPDDTLRPLTPEPVRETSFTDRDVKPGVRYRYAIVAVDRAGNRSEPARVEETAR